MADDRLKPCRSVSIFSASSENVMCRRSAISLNVLQNASSRLTLVLWPATTMERLTTENLIARLPMPNRRVDGAHHHLSAIIAEWLNAQNSYVPVVSLYRPRF